MYIKFESEDFKTQLCIKEYKKMRDLTQKTKKEYAQMLFTRENLSQAEIAEKVGVSRVTISRWAKDGHWDELKVSITITRDEQLKLLYRQLAELNRTISERNTEEGPRYATAAEADTITKLSKAIKKLETDVRLDDIISAFSQFLTWMRSFDIEETKRIAPFFDAFVKSKL